LLKVQDQRCLFRSHSK